MVAPKRQFLLVHCSVVVCSYGDIGTQTYVVPRYSFTISQGGQPQPSNTFDCKDDGAAKKEASGTFADMSRDISKRLQLDDPDWQIEVADEAGKSIFTIRVTAE
jgi:hypothetical protein